MLKTLSEVTTAKGTVMKVGMPLTKPGNIAAYFAAVALIQSPTDKPLGLSGDQIRAIVDAVPEGDDPEAREDEIVRQLLVADGQQSEESEETDEETDEDETEDETSDEAGEQDATDEDDKMPEEKPTAIQSEAVKAMERAVKDTVLSNIVRDAATADLTLKFTPLQFRQRLVTLYGTDLDTFPVPGSKSSDKDLGNRVADYRRIRVPKASGDGTKWVKVSYVQTCADLLPEAVAALDVLKQVAAANTRGKGAGIFAKKTVTERGQAVKDAKATLASARGNFRKALSLHHMIYECSNLPDVDVSFRKNEKGEAEKTRVPMVIKNKKNDDLREYYTVAQFLALDPSDCRDPAKLKEHDGSVYSTLIASGMRGTGQRRGKDVCKPITNRDQWEGALAEVAAYTEERLNAANINKWLAITNGEDSSDAMLESMETIIANLTPYVQANRERLAKLHRDANEREKAAA